MNNHNPAVETIFNAAKALPPNSRKDYLDLACREDAALRHEVERLLAAADRADGFFEAKPVGLTHLENTAVDSTVREGPGTKIGRYKLLQQIGEGGFGVVFMAEQQEPVWRKVALKIIKLGMDTKSVVARFEAERQALALMDHPNIARVLDGGATDTGRPYFVMELVQGVPITDFCDTARLSAKERLGLFIQVCQAIQSAHQKGIIHRDIKPSNVLVTLHDGVPVPKVIDFGIAKATNQKLTEKTIFTQFATMIGTPAYMSPEQAELSGLDLDTRTDIYALGVLLYELLTGSTPFPEKRLRSLAYGELQRVILEEEPERPSTRLSTLTHQEKSVIARNCGQEFAALRNLLRGDLDWVVMKCLEKDRRRRYDTANDLAADLKRHLDNEPIVARPPSLGYRVQKAVRRNKVAFASAATVFVALLLGVGVSTWQATVASHARNREREANQRLRTQVTETQAAQQHAERAAESEAEQRRQMAGIVEKLQLEKAEGLLQGSESPSGVAYLASLLRANPSNHVAASRLVSAVQRPFGVPLTKPLLHDSGVQAAQFSPNGLQLVTVADQTARVWEARTGRPLTEPLRHEQSVLSAEFSPDGRSLVTASFDKTAKVWDTSTGRSLTEPLRHEGPVTSALFNPDGSQVVTASFDATARIWDVHTGRPLTEPLRHAWPVSSARFIREGLQVVTVHMQGMLQVWDARTGQAVTEPRSLGRGIMFPRFSPDGSRLVTSGGSVPPGWYDMGMLNDQVTRVWDTRTAQPLTEPLPHDSTVRSARFSPEGGWVVTVAGRSARIWDVRTGQQRGETLTHKSEIQDAAFSPEGLRVVTASSDNTARVWDARTGLPLTEPLPHGGAVTFALFSPDGSLLVTTSNDKTARVWDAHPGRRLTEPLQHAGWVNFAEFSPDGLRVATAWGGERRPARVWDANTGLPVGERLSHEGPVLSARFSPDGSKVLTASTDATARIWDALTGQPSGEPLAHPDVVLDARFSPDGSGVVTASADAARLWEAQTGRAVQEPLRHEHRVNAAVFSPDGSMVATASADDTARVWDASTGLPLTEPLRHENDVLWVEFSPDGKLVVTASDDRTARVWDARTGKPVLGPLRHDGEVFRARFSPDGQRLVTVSADRTARLWDARTGLALAEPLRHEDSVYGAAFSPDSSRLVTASGDRTARLWDARTGLALAEPLHHEDRVMVAAFNPDGLRLVTASSDKTARVWEVPPVPVPVPSWFLDWAEARVGFRYTSSGEVEPVPFEEQRQQQEQVRLSTGADLFSRVAQWVHADPATRPISPGAFLTTKEYVSRRMAEGSLSSLQEALLISPGNGLAWARLALQVSHQIADHTRSSGDPELLQSQNESVAWAWQALRLKFTEGDLNDLLLAEAERTAERALRLDPGQAEGWQARATVEWLRNRPTEALAALDRTLGLRPDLGEAWELKADILRQQERLPEALDAYSRWIALLPLTDKVQGGERLRALDKHAAVCRSLGRWDEAITDLRAGGVPARDPAAEPGLVDLSAFYNLEFGEGLVGQLTGTRTIEGIRFDARGCLFLASSKFYPNRVPQQMTGIPVATKGARIHFLHGAFFGHRDPVATTIAKYVLHYADGTSLERPLVLGRDVLDTKADPPPPGEGKPRVACVLTEWNDRLYLTTWDNPYPEKEIASLDFISFRQTAAPFLVAVTVE